MMRTFKKKYQLTKCSSGPPRTKENMKMINCHCTESNGMSEVAKSTVCHVCVVTQRWTPLWTVAVRQEGRPRSARQDTEMQISQTQECYSINRGLFPCSPTEAKGTQRRQLQSGGEADWIIIALFTSTKPVSDYVVKGRVGHLISGECPTGPALQQ